MTVIISVACKLHRYMMCFKKYDAVHSLRETQSCVSLFRGQSGFQFKALHLLPEHIVREVELIVYSN